MIKIPKIVLVSKLYLHINRLVRLVLYITINKLVGITSTKFLDICNSEKEANAFGRNYENLETSKITQTVNAWKGWHD